MAEYSDSNQVPDIRRFAGLGTPAGDELFPGAAGFSPEARSAAIRAAADGELTESQLALLTESGECAGEIAFERGLREATGRVMNLDGLSAPAGLRERILAASAAGRAGGQAVGLAVGESGSAHDVADELSDDLAGAMEARGAQTRSASFWNRASTRRLAGALAASLLLAFVGLFGWQMMRVTGGGASTAYRTNLAQFVAGEHTRSLDDAYADRKYIYKAPQVAADAMQAELHHTPVIPPCGDSSKFRGASPCGMPGKGPSAHMQFVLPAQDVGADGEDGDAVPGRKVSVFVKEDMGELDIPEGTSYTINAAACDLTDVYICVWRRDGLLYTLVSEDRDAPLCSKFLGRFGVEPPDPAHSL